MGRTVVGLFNGATAAQQAIEQLLAIGFQRSNLNLATRETLRAAHLPGPNSPVPTESLEEGIVRFFTDLVAGNENAEAQARHLSTRPDSAVLAVNPGSEEEAERARVILQEYGAVDVYKQVAKPDYVPPQPTLADGIVDLESSLSRVRDGDELDANGLTTH